MRFSSVNAQFRLWNSIKNALSVPADVAHNVVFPHVVSCETSIIPEDIPRPDYSMTAILAQQSRNKIDIKTASEILKMEKACSIARSVLEKASTFVQPGVTTDFIDKMVHREIISRGAYPSPLHYRGFPKSCCTSVNNVVVHGIPDERKLLEGDIINIDVTVFHDGHHGDTSDTFPIGEVDAAAANLIRATRGCLQLGIEACGPGAKFSDIGRAIEPRATELSFTVCRNYVGHGIGRYFHGPPNVHHCQRFQVSSRTMEPGMTFTVEPILMEGHSAIRKLDDGWTVVSVDNCRSAQAEHTVLITESGVRVLT